MTSDGNSVDFLDFPSFDQNEGQIGGSLVWIAQANDKLFPVSSDFSSIKYNKLFPICSMPNIYDPNDVIVTRNDQCSEENKHEHSPHCEEEEEHECDFHSMYRLGYSYTVKIAKTTLGLY